MLPDKLLYTRAEAAEALCCSTSTLDLMIRRGMLKTIRRGPQRVFIHRTEVERAAKRETGPIWPQHRLGADGKRHTTRLFEGDPAREQARRDGRDKNESCENAS